MIDEAGATRLFAELGRKISGDVDRDEISRLIFATDASLYQIKPLGVVLPRTRSELVQVVRTTAKYHVPILPRGGGTSLAGQTVTAGLVVDCSKYLDRILQTDPDQRFAWVEPGVVLDNLNAALRSSGLFFAPDVATSSRATIGGMTGNNSAGVRSVRYGKTIDHVLEMKVVLSTGERLHLRPLNRDQLDAVCRQQDREGQIHRTVRGLVREYRAEIEKRYPKVMRRVGGYNLDALLDEDRFNLASLVVGSEGTLAAVTEIKVNLEPVPSSRVVAVLHFQELLAAVDTVEPILDYFPSAVEIIDPHGIELALKNPAVADLCRQFIQGSPRSLLIVEFSGQRESEVRDSLKAMGSDPRIANPCYAIFEAWEEHQQEMVWQVRKNALGVLLSLRGDAKPLPFVEDASVPVSHLTRYISQMLALCERLQRPVAMYAHASVGVIHVRPILNLKQAEDVQIMQTISEECFKLVRRYGGAWSGEHGDGLVRSYKNREFFGEKLYRAFQAIKEVFDPPGLMNPGKIVDAPPMTENLRIHPGYRTHYPPTHFRFAQDGGLDRAIEMCTGVGQCRKTLGGTMCPSYMATRDEEHSTRGRANALRAAIAGDLGSDGFTSHQLYDVLDLCLECKACKSECPSNVDMARLKAEFLAHYYQEHGLPLAKRAVASFRRSAERAARLPGLANALFDNRFSRWGLEKLFGLDRRRRLPRFADQTFTHWFTRRKRSGDDVNRVKVAVFADTFTDFFQPQVGRAAVQVLEHLNFEVKLISGFCCGRPLISAGQLEGAARLASLQLTPLLEAAKDVDAVVVLEPSCLVTLVDDLPDLQQVAPEWSTLATKLVSLEAFLIRPGLWERFRTACRPQPLHLILHGHCQQSAVLGKGSTLRMFSAGEGWQVRALDSGCCGMAGSFGYEKEHYELSRRIGEDRLFPALRDLSSEDLVVAPGFSCRAQIEHFTSRAAFHPAQVLAQALR